MGGDGFQEALLQGYEGGSACFAGCGLRLHQRQARDDSEFNAWRSVRGY